MFHDSCVALLLCLCRECWNRWSPWTNRRRTIVIGDGGKKEEGDVVAVERDGNERKDGAGLQNG